MTVRLAATALLLVAAAPPPGIPGQPWSVPSRSPVATRDLTFVSHGATLSGTLYAPAGPRFPVVVVFHGAALGSRDQPLFAHLKQALPALGIGVFVYDRRGSGRSGGGGPAATDFDTLADDGVAAMRMLGRLPQVDGRRIGFWGLSQGGWLSLLAAAKARDAAFAISISAPMTGADVQMNSAVANVLRISGYPQAEIDAAIAARTTVDDYRRGRRDRASAERAVAEARAKPWWKLIYLEGNIDDPSWPAQMASDPLAALDRSKVPTLMLYGQGDPWVPVGLSLERLDATAARHPNVTLRVIDGADHEMALGIDPKAQIDISSIVEEAPNAPAYFATLAAWMAARGLTR